MDVLFGGVENSPSFPPLPCLRSGSFAGSSTRLHVVCMYYVHTKLCVGVPAKVLLPPFSHCACACPCPLRAGLRSLRSCFYVLLSQVWVREVPLPPPCRNGEEGAARPPRLRWPLPQHPDRWVGFGPLVTNKKTTKNTKRKKTEQITHHTTDVDVCT